MTDCQYLGIWEDETKHKMSHFLGTTQLPQYQQILVKWCSEGKDEVSYSSKAYFYVMGFKNMSIIISDHM